MNRPILRAGGALLVALHCACGYALAQGFPGKPVRLIVPAAAGGPTDVVARTLAPKLGEHLGQALIVDNRGGAGGVVGTEALAKAPADGYTLAIVFISHATNPTLYAKLPYDTLKDFAAIGMVGHQTTVLVVHPSVPAKSVGDLVALAKARPGALSYAADTASAAHLAGELFRYMSGTSIVHVAFKGNGPALVDTLAGHVPFMFNAIVTSLPHVKAGRLRALAVSSTQRSQLAPDLPTVSESGLRGFEVTAWYGMVAPARTPAEVMRKLSAEVGRTLRLPELRERLSAQGVELTPGTPEQFDLFVRGEISKWEKVLTAAGIRAQ